MDCLLIGGGGSPGRSSLAASYSPDYRKTHFMYINIIANKYKPKFQKGKIIHENRKTNERPKGKSSES